MLPGKHTYGLNPRCILFTAGVAMSVVIPHYYYPLVVVGAIGAFVTGVAMVFLYHVWWKWRRPALVDKWPFTVFSATTYGTLLALLCFLGGSDVMLGLKIFLGTMGGIVAYCLLAWLDEVSLDLAAADRMAYAFCYGEIAKPRGADSNPFLFNS
jgi:hypothetical protein